VNDRYEYGDRSPAHLAVFSARAQHRPHAQSCTCMIDHTLSAIEHTRNRGLSDLFLGHFSLCPYHCSLLPSTVPLTAPVYPLHQSTHRHSSPLPPPLTTTLQPSDAAAQHHSLHCTTSVVFTSYHYKNQLHNPIFSFFFRIIFFSLFDKL
jgi:hypothetical protein